ncbi:tetratricopeptide repeat protein [Streptomyces sp. NPDC059248]|uniref:tetratricopeptide repeat protein n=1 Tax=Streptomyces sp. NPDC059248 TaxID=3346791 RepID=UPI0036C48D89
MGAGGDITGSALGDGGQVQHINEQHIHHHPDVREGVVWPVVAGQIPQLASASQLRTAVREEVEAARAAGGSVVLTQVLSGGGGVGKTQLAAAYAHQALREEHADLVVWVAAAEEQQIVAAYARAASLVQAPGAAGTDPEGDARAFLTWLATTQRRWMVVLDDIADPGAVRRWWPAGHARVGWALATTRLEDAAITGGGRTRVRVDVYTPGEAGAYLRERLAAEGVVQLLDEGVGELASALGFLPLALGHAAAYMINQHLTAGEYLDRFADAQTRLDQVLPASADTEDYGRTVAATLLVGLDAVRAVDTTGLAEPAVQLISLLDPAGHPARLWETGPVLDHLAQHRAAAPVPAAEAAPSASAGDGQLPAHTDGTGDGEEPQRPDAGKNRAALRVLHRYALITHMPEETSRVVRVHALTARAVRETLTDAQLGHTAKAAADGLLACWPDPDTHPDHHELAAALRANADTHLWYPGGHVVLFRAGRSLNDAGLHTAAVARWQQLKITSERILGPEHPDTLTTRNNLAHSYWQDGRTQDATRIEEQLLTDHQRILGPEHPDTVGARAALAQWQEEPGKG